MHSQVIYICIHVAAAAEEIISSPGAYLIILNYDTYIQFYYLCITFQELIGTLVA